MTACGSTRTSPSGSWGECRHPGAPRDEKAGRAGPGADTEVQTSEEGPGKMILAGAPLGERHPYDVTRP